MEEFNASLVREKIIFVDDGMDPEIDGDGGPTVIRSNRMFLKLTDKKTTEKVVVRAQNMHTTLRLASKAMFSYYKNGLFLPRPDPYDWEATWEAIIPNYEKDFNPNIWAAVYINGQSVFKTTTSPFVDVVEKCALLTVDNYDATMEVTESALKQIGKAMRINHSSNVAAVFNDSEGQMHCGIIHRADGKDTTFSFLVGGGADHNRITQSISIAAAFLEAINLRFVTKALQLKLRGGTIEYDENRRLRSAMGRLVSLNKGILSFEETYEVKYRPEKPDFFSASY